MSRIPLHTRGRAMQQVRAMGLKPKEQFADERYRLQPQVLASCLVQRRLGVRLEKMGFPLDVVFVCFQAMKESGLSWPLITEDERDRQMTRLVASIGFGESLPAEQRDHAVQQYIEAHPEKALLAPVYAETCAWLQRVVPEDADNYVVLAALNLVNYLAFVPMSGERTRGTLDGAGQPADGAARAPEIP